jgi:hypothetical protein
LPVRPLDSSCAVCRVVRDSGAVVLRDLLGSGIAAVSDTEYRFSEANYEAVVKVIWRHARARRAGRDRAEVVRHPGGLRSGMNCDTSGGP